MTMHSGTGSRTRISILGLALWLSSAAPVIAFGLLRDDYMSRGNYGETTPVDLPRPPDSITAKVYGAAGHVGSGTVIAPHWIVTAGHLPTDASSRVIVDGQVYPVVERVVPENARGLAGDIALLRIASDEPLSHVRMYAMPFVDMTFSAGGYGLTYTNHDERGAPSATGGPLSLRWVRNRFSTVGDVFTANFDAPDGADFVPYEGTSLPGDSGAGVLVRDGLEWKIAAVSTSSGFSGPTIANHVDWITATIRKDIAAHPEAVLTMPQVDFLFDQSEVSGHGWRKSARFLPCAVARKPV